MNESNLTQSLHDATTGVAGPNTPFATLAAVGRRRQQHRVVGLLVASIAMVGASLGLVTLAQRADVGRDLSLRRSNRGGLHVKFGG